MLIKVYAKDLRIGDRFAMVGCANCSHDVVYWMRNGDRVTIGTTQPYGEPGDISIGMDAQTIVYLQTPEKPNVTVKLSQQKNIAGIKLNGAMSQMLYLLTPESNTEEYQKNDDLRIKLERGDSKGDVTLYLQGEYTTIGDVAECAGMGTYDCAIPQGFIEEQMAQNKGWRGIWSYDENRIFGEFIPLSELLRRIGIRLARNLDHGTLEYLNHSKREL